MLQRLAETIRPYMICLKIYFVGRLGKTPFFEGSQGSMLVIRPCKMRERKGFPSGKLSPKVTDETELTAATRLSNHR